jgi:hypothetical protein
MSLNQLYVSWLLVGEYTMPIAIDRHAVVNLCKSFPVHVSHVLANYIS